MSRAWWSASVLVIALACSGTSTMDHEQLASERKQIHSLDAEALLFERVLDTRHVTHAFARGHATYLRHAAHEIVEKLAKARPAAGAEGELQQARADATRLEERFIGVLLRLQ